MAVIKLKLIQFSCIDLALEELVFHAQLLVLFLQVDELLLLLPNLLINIGALRVESFALSPLLIQICREFLHRTELSIFVFKFTIAGMQFAKCTFELNEEFFLVTANLIFQAIDHTLDLVMHITIVFVDIISNMRWNRVLVKSIFGSDIVLGLPVVLVHLFQLITMPLDQTLCRLVFEKATYWVKISLLMHLFLALYALFFLFSAMHRKCCHTFLFS